MFGSHKKRLPALVALSSLLISGIAQADVWQERELLQRWIAQTDSLNEILEQAEFSSDPNRRAQLNYSALKRDIEETINKVNHYLDAPTTPFNDYMAKKHEN